jgi:holo-[acyl-carrier protein] synthase
MICGIGTDTVKIARIERLYNLHQERFARRLLGPAEFIEFTRRLARQPAGRDRAIRYLAKRFAAKEAFSKAVGLGFRGPMTLQSVEFLNDSRGAPYAQARKLMVSFMQDRQWVAHVSITDEIDTATALVIMETQQ